MTGFQEECPRCGGEMLKVDGRYLSVYWRCRVCDSICGDRLLPAWRGWMLFKQLLPFLLTRQEPKDIA